MRLDSFLRVYVGFLTDTSGTQKPQNQPTVSPMGTQINIWLLLSGFKFFPTVVYPDKSIWSCPSF